MNLELGSKLVQQHRLERLAQAQTYREAKKRRPGQDHLAELLRGLGDKAARIVSNLRRSLQIELGWDQEVNVLVTGRNRRAGREVVRALLARE